MVILNRTTRCLAPLGLLAAVVLLSGCGLLNMAMPIAAAKLSFGCLPEGTRVDTPAGPRFIETLRTGELVIGFDGAPVPVLQKHEYAEDPVQTEFLTVEFSSGARLTLSGMHRIDGVPAADLVPGDRIADQVVVRVTPGRGVQRSFDLLTTDRGYRLDGIPVNSMIGEMAAATR